MARLVIQCDGKEDRIESLDRPETIVGRLPQCQLQLTTELHVSREHARIRRDETGFWIENISTRNNTGLNGRNIDKRIPLRDGDQIDIWKFRLFFEDDSDEPLPDRRFGIIARIAAIDEAPGNLSPSQMSAVLQLAQFACLKSLRKVELLEKVGGLLQAVFPAAQTIGLLVQQTGERRGLLTEMIFPADGRSTVLEPDQSIAHECIHTRQGMLCAELGCEVSPSPTESGTAICAPLISDGSISFGAVWLAASLPCFCGSDVRILCWVARLLGAALGSARSHDAAIAQAMQAGDNQIARRIQSEFLPRHRPQVNGYGFFHHYVPAQSVGGDYFDYIWLPDRRLAVLIADVAGKGVPAALLMSRLSAEARYCLMAHPYDLARALQQLNVSMSDVMGDRFVTLVACILSPSTHRVQIACAGHEPPCVLRAGANSFDSPIGDEFRGPLLGIIPDASFRVSEIALKPGDNVLLFTDGVTDARDFEERSFGLIKLLNVPKQTLMPPNGSLSAESLLKSVVNKVNDHIASEKQFDDITLVCFGREPEETGASQIATGEYGPTPK